MNSRPFLQSTLLPCVGLLAWLLCPGGTARADHLINGSFKEGTAGWTVDQNSGTATFTPASVDTKAGTNLLRVVVTNAGSAPEFPRLTQAGKLPAREGDTYTLSFFARCPESKLDNRPARLRIHLDGGSTTFSCDFQPFDKWQEFHYAFKTAGSVTFSITFENTGTYELNRLLLEDQNEPVVNNQAVIDTPTTYLWQWGQEGYARTHQDAVIGTDNDIAQRLPDGRIAWIFNDSNLGPLDLSTNYRGGNSNLESSMVRNCIVVQTGDTLALVKPKESFVPPDHRHLFWPTDATVEGDKLQVLVEETDPKTLAGLSSSLVSLPLNNLADDNPPLVRMPMSGEILDACDGYYYIYDDRLGPARKVARVPVGSLGKPEAWTFYNGSTWVADKAAAIPLGGLASAPNAGASFERLGPNNFVAMSYGRQGDTIGVHFAPTPVGPWTNYIPIYTVPHEEGQFYYDPHIYKHSGQNGTYSVGFSDYCWGWDPGKPFDKCYYWPQFIKTPNLLAMSPYTSGTFRDDCSDGSVSNWQIEGGNWRKRDGVLAVDAAKGDRVRAVAKGVVLSDLVFDATVQANAPDASVGVTFRGDAGNGYLAALTTGGSVSLSKVEAGRAVPLATAPLTVAAGMPYHLKVVAAGDSLKVFVADMVNPVLALRDGTYSKGGVGLQADSGGGSFDDIAATDGCYEVETLAVVATSGVPASKLYEAGASAGSAVTLEASKAGDNVVFKVPGVSPGKYRVLLRVRQGHDGGIVELSAGQSVEKVRPLDKPMDTFQAENQYREVALGPLAVDAQQDEFFKLTVTGKNAAADGCRITVDSIKLVPAE